METRKFKAKAMYVVFCCVICDRPRFLWSPNGVGQTIIFLPCDFYLLFSLA